MGDVVQLPAAKRWCFDCVHAVDGEQVFCLLFREVILFESVATNCEGFETDEGRS